MFLLNSSMACVFISVEFVFCSISLFVADARVVLTFVISSMFIWTMWSTNFQATNTIIQMLAYLMLLVAYTFVIRTFLRQNDSTKQLQYSGVFTFAKDSAWMQTIMHHCKFIVRKHVCILGDLQIYQTFAQSIYISGKRVRACAVTLW